MADINLGVGGANSASGAFEISNSLKLEEDNTEYLHYTPSSQTDYERLAFSIWIKRTEIGSTSKLAEFGNGSANTNNLRIGFDDNDRLFIYGNSIVWRESTRVFRDTSAWYHLFFLFDTTTPGGVSNNRIRVWVNGSMIAHTDYNTVNNPGAGSAMGFNTTLPQSIGTQQEGGVNASTNFNGYIAQVWYSGGTPPVVTDFGEYDDDSGIWKPKDISSLSIPDASGFFLDFSDSSDLGNDSSSNNNDFTLVNITAADQATDTPTNNFCTMNPLYVYSNQATITEGGTSVGYPGSAWRGAKGSIGVINGKWYFEIGTSGSYHANLFGIQSSNVSSDLSSGNAMNHNNSIYIGYGSGNYYYYTGGSQTGNESTGWNSGGDWGASDIFGFALDLDSSTKKFILYRNGSAVNGSGTNLPSAFQDEYLSPFAAGYDAYEQYWNFGGYTQISISSAASDANGYGNFEYAPPSGYYALCTQNLAEYG